MKFIFAKHRHLPDLHLIITLFCACAVMIGCANFNINVNIKDSAKQQNVEETIASSPNQQSEEPPSSQPTPLVEASNQAQVRVNIPTPTELVPLQEIHSISAGAEHVCVLTTAGGVQCWGRNHFGQLGAGPVPTSSTPQSVIGLATGVLSIVAGVDHTCALLQTGKVRCWGKNLKGQLGNLTVFNRNGPTDVIEVKKAIQSLALGDGYTCALSDEGGVLCWGKNKQGQLGNGSTADSIRPVEVSGLTSDVTAIASGNGHACALTTEGGVKCWGANQHGQLGDGTVVDQSNPVDVIDLTSGVIAIAASQGSVEASSTCALTVNGSVKCWGSNHLGQLGNGATVKSSTPVDVLGLENDVTEITVGALHACALNGTGDIKCWGENLHSELDAKKNLQIETDTNIEGVASDIQAISAGSSYTCVLTIEGGVQCWGSNLYGQLGDGSIRASTQPQKVVGLGGSVDKIVAGDQYSCALLLDGQVECWGSNAHGQLGNGAQETFRHTPAPVERLMLDVVDIAGKYEHTCALTKSGEVWCWGNNFRGQLAIQEEFSALPVPISGLESEISAIATGHKLTCAVTALGGLKCWGRHYGIQLDAQNASQSDTPTEFQGLTNNIHSVSLGHHHNCILNTSGGVECWGKDANAELGDGSTPLTKKSRLPLAVYGLNQGVAAIDTGINNSCALTEDGGVKCWGKNGQGQAGNGTSGRGQSWPIPVDVIGLGHGVAAISVGAHHVCALTDANRVWCWGGNDNGELGNGTSGHRSIPKEVVNLHNDVISIAAGHDHSCAIDIAGDVWCWGANTMGQLGIESFYESPLPQDVMVAKPREDGSGSDVHGPKRTVYNDPP